MFKQLTEEFGIKHVLSSAYHPESQGVLERFHSTLKNMLSAYCVDNKKNWDECIPFLMFAVRDTVQETLSFTPFELVFGHEVRGPLKALEKVLLEKTNDDRNVLLYVQEFRERLTEAWLFAHKNLKKVQLEMKQWYDGKGTVERNFNVGDKVLALLPIPGTPLSARYSGPYVVSKKLGQVNYVIDAPD